MSLHVAVQSTHPISTKLHSPLAKSDQLQINIMPFGGFQVQRPLCFPFSTFCLIWLRFGGRKTYLPCLCSLCICLNKADALSSNQRQKGSNNLLCAGGGGGGKDNREEAMREG